MHQQRRLKVGRYSFEPYWPIIVVLILIGAGLYLWHLASGRTPDRVAIHIAPISFDIYWYGILIMAGVALGTYVTSRLAGEKALRIYRQSVPAELRSRELAELDLDDGIKRKLRKRGVRTLGDLLLQWGLAPDDLDLDEAQQLDLEENLPDISGFESNWLDDPPWSYWNPDHAWIGVTWSLVLAVVGARIYHILTPSPSLAAVGIDSAADYFNNPMQLINLRNGGLGLYGGIAGGALGLALYARRHRLPFLLWADLAVVGFALGQAIGRWGNFLNQELYGRPTQLPWALYVDRIHRIDGYASEERFHPAFLYESLWSLLTFFVLLFLIKRRRENLRTGDMTALFLLFYASGRILLELVRLDSRTTYLGPIAVELPVATIVSIAIGLSMAGIILWRHRQQLSELL